MSSKSNIHNKTTDPSSKTNVPDMQSAMTISTINALAGENVHHHLDSSHRTIQRSLSHPSEMDNAQLTLTRKRSNSSNGTSTPTQNYSPTRAQQQQYPRSISSSSSHDRELAESVGFMAQGLAWIREQSHRRRRQYLQNQAEQQARIIKQAQEEAIEAQRQREEELRRQQEQLARERDLRVSLGLEGNSTFQNITKHNQQLPNSGNCHNNSTLTNIAVDSVLPSVAGICGIRSKSESDDDYEEEINFVTSNCMITEDHFSAKSRSGDGYTVQLDIGNDITTNNIQQQEQQQQQQQHQQQQDATTPSNGLQPQQEQQQELDMDDEEEESFVPKVRIEEEINLESHPYILNETEMQHIAIHVLPRTIAYAKWKRLYSLARDGDSFDACLRLVQNNKSTLMVVRTSKNSIFGGYADSPWEPPSSSHIGIRYYGNAGACLFTCPRYATRSPPKNNNSSNSDSNTMIRSPPKTPVPVVHYKWTGMNRYIQLCDVNRRMLAFGGGGENGEFGLCVEHDFQHGSTGACDTFGNLPLCHDSQFDIVDMEIYGFCIGQF